MSPFPLLHTGSMYWLVVRLIFCMFVCLIVWVFVWVCESYIVHHFNGTGLRCAPLTCIVHHGSHGGPMSLRSRGHPPTFFFFFFGGGSHETCTKQPLLVRAREHTGQLTANILGSCTRALMQSIVFQTHYYFIPPIIKY